MNIRKIALINSLATAGYVVLVGCFMYFGSQVRLGKENTFLAPIALLMLFVFSAALTGYLIFGKPAQFYVDGKKKEALALLFHTLGYFSIITLVALLLLVFLTN